MIIPGIVRLAAAIPIALVLALGANTASVMAGDGGATDATVTTSTKPSLEFKEDGTFKVLMFSDFQDVLPINKNTISAMNRILDTEKPDFVMMAGDLAVGGVNTKTLPQFIEQMSAPMESRHIPWAHVYGNHDQDHGITKEKQQPVYESHPYYIGQWGPKDIGGVANYVLPIKASKGDDVVFNLWGIDSNRYLSDNNKWHRNLQQEILNIDKGLQGKETYDFVKFPQIMWYWNTSLDMEKQYGHKIPSLMFMHIALPEHRIISMNPEKTKMVGEKNEEECNSPVNSGLFVATLQRGDIKGIFVGHDHVNTYVGTYAGIELGYDAGIGYATYGLGEGADKDKLRGGRVFVLHEDNLAKFDTYMVYAKDIK